MRDIIAGIAMSTLEILQNSYRRVVRDKAHVVLLRELPHGVSLDGSQLDDAVLTQARVLRERGVHAGDCVLIRCPGGPGFTVAVLASWQAGACCLLADGAATPADLARLSRLFHPVAALGESPYGTATRTGDLECWIPESGDRPRPPLPAGAAVIKLTSGTTGQPRGVVVTAPQLWVGARQILDTMNIRPTDVNIAAISLSHSYGFDNLILPLVVQGSPIAVVPVIPPDLLARALGMVEACVFPGVPYLFDMLCRSGVSWKPTGLRLCISAGAPLSASVSRAFQQRFGLRLRSFYGASEAGGISFEREEAADPIEGCVGKPLAGVQLELEPLDGIEARPGAGRVIVKSASVAQGYISAGPEDEAPTDGRFATGDIGRLDSDGRLHLLGRLDHLVNIAGRKVNPLEVERTLRAVESVRDAAVVTIPDQRRGQALAACVEVDSPLNRADILTALGSRLPRFKMPRQLLLVEKLPRTERGKPDLDRIRELLDDSMSTETPG